MQNMQRACGLLTLLAFVPVSFTSSPLMHSESFVLACTLPSRSGVITYNNRLFRLLVRSNYSVRFLIADNSPLLDFYPKRG